jgi:hypothetical protein
MMEAVAYEPLKRRFTSKRPHGDILYKDVLFMIAAVRT